jgi:hypothetical protein
MGDRADQHIHRGYGDPLRAAGVRSLRGRLVVFRTDRLIPKSRERSAQLLELSAGFDAG